MAYPIQLEFPPTFPGTTKKFSIVAHADGKEVFTNVHRDDGEFSLVIVETTEVFPSIHVVTMRF